MRGGRRPRDDNSDQAVGIHGRQAGVEAGWCPHFGCRPSDRNFKDDAMKEAANEGGLHVQALSWNSSIAGGAP